MRNKMMKNAKKLMTRTNLMLTLLNNGIVLPYLLRPLWRLNFGLPSRRGTASGSEEDLTTLLRAVVLPLPVISNGSLINGGTATSVFDFSVFEVKRVLFRSNENCVCSVTNGDGWFDRWRKLFSLGKKKKSVWANLKMGWHWASNFGHIRKVWKIFSELFLS
jgi:hypothetical protein